MRPVFLTQALRDESHDAEVRNGHERESNQDVIRHQILASVLEVIIDYVIHQILVVHSVNHKQTANSKRSVKCKLQTFKLHVMQEIGRTSFIPNVPDHIIVARRSNVRKTFVPHRPELQQVGKNHKENHCVNLDNKNYVFDFVPKHDESFFFFPLYVFVVVLNIEKWEAIGNWCHNVETIR